MRYITERISKETKKAGVLIYLDQSKSFIRVDSQYLEAIIASAALGPGYRICIAGMVKVNSYSTESFSIAYLVHQ